MKDKNNYIKGKKLSEEFLEIVRNHESTDTFSKLVSALNESDEPQELLNRLSSPERAAEIHARANAASKEQEIKRLIQTIENQKKRNLLRRQIMIASAGTVAAAMILLFVNLQSTEEPIKEVAVVTTDQPTLRIGNKRAINLEEELNANAYGVEKLSANKIKQNENVAEAEIAVLNIPSKYTYSIVLEDGTEVFLNANSEFQYPTKFATDERRVELKGEAYFKVTKSPIPFIVKVGEMAVRVLGTEFVVNSNRKNSVETVLLSGSVAVGNKGSEVIIQPGEMATYNAVSGESRVKRVDVSKYTNWMDGVFRYKGSSLVQILEDLSAWYGVEFKGVETMDPMIITIFMDRTAPLEEILHFIEEMANVKFIKERSNSYYISR